MSECCPENKSKLKINLGNFISLNSLKKTIWSIAYFFGNNIPEIIITTNKDIDEIICLFEKFSTRIKWTIIKTDTINLDDNKAFDLCNTFCEENTLKISSNSFFYKEMNLNKPISFKSYLLPKYVQEAIEEYGQNKCSFYEKECFKYPLNNDFYFIKSDDKFSDTNIFCIEEDIENNVNYTEMSIDEILQLSKITRS